jgi:hypothetical protein
MVLDAMPIGMAKVQDPVRGDDARRAWAVVVEHAFGSGATIGAAETRANTTTRA